MNIRMQARTLAMASLLAVATLGIPAVQAYAKPAPPPVMCVMQNGDDFGFYLPGETYTSPGGSDGTSAVTLMCGADGQWHQIASVQVGHSGPALPRPGESADPATLAIP